MMKRFLSIRYLVVLFAACGVLASVQSQSQTTPDANAAPNVFVQQVADQALLALKADNNVRAGDTVRVNEIVDALLLPYVDFKIAQAKFNIEALNANAQIFTVSSLTGEGMPQWLNWLEQQLDDYKQQSNSNNNVKNLNSHIETPMVSSHL